jgi:membrane associated rhomboid family serine protease
MASFGERSGFGGLNMVPPVIKWLLILNAAFFILGFLPGGTYQGMPLTMEAQFLRFGGLWPIGDELFMPWQYFTYMFLHGSIGHIFLNMLVLWMFGMELELMWGSKRFLVYYLVCGIGAGLLHSVITMWMGTGAPTVGASGAIMGLMVGFAMIFPDRMIFMMFIPLKAKYAVLLYTALDLYYGVAQTSDNVAHFAHLGGALVGFLMLQIGGKMTLGGIFDRFSKGSSPAPIPRPTARVRDAGPGRVIDVEFRDLSRRQSEPQMNFGDAQERVDAILDKISRSGYQTLTDEEKSILLEASRRMK